MNKKLSAYLKTAPKLAIKAVSLLMIIFPVLFLNSAGQNLESLELVEQSVPFDNGSPETGATTTLTNIPFWHNVNNPDKDKLDIRQFFPEISVSITISGVGTDPLPQHPDDVSSVVMGYSFTNPVLPEQPLIVPFDYLDESVDLQDPVGENWYSVDDMEEFYSSTIEDIETGVSFSQNYGVFMSASFQHLRDEPYHVNDVGQEYALADVEIEFSRAIYNPIIHLFGLGGLWEWEATDNSDKYINSASVEFEILSIEDDNGVEITDSEFSVISANPGRTEFDFDLGWGPGDDFDTDGCFPEHPDDAATGLAIEGNKIINTWNIPYVLDTFSSACDNIGVANGSVLFEAFVDDNGQPVKEKIKTINLRMWVRAPYRVDEFRDYWDSFTDDTHPNYDPDPEFDNYIAGSNLFGWGGTDGELFGEYDDASDGFIMSFSTDVDPDITILTEGDSYRMLSSPVVNNVNDPEEGRLTYRQLIGDFWVQGLGGSADDNYWPGGDPNIYTWELGRSFDSEETNADPWFPWQTPNSVNDQIPPSGQGFLMTVFASDDGPPEIAWPVDGKPLSVVGSEPAPPIIVNDGGGDNEGWLLLGNPFKDPILIQELLSTRISDNLNEVVYIWDRGEGDGQAGFDPDEVDPTDPPGWRYGILDIGTSPTGPDADGFPILGSIDGGVIMPFQGFFIQRNDDGNDAIVTFDNDDDLTRDDLTDPDATGTFYRKEAPSVNNVLALNIRGENLSNSLWFRFSENGSTERLRNDALELASYNNEYVYFATRKESGDLLTFSNLPIPGDEFEIPVTVETTNPGLYTISASNFNLSMAHDLYLVDTHEDVSVRIDPNFEYSFTIDHAAKSNPLSPKEAIMRGPQKAVTQYADRFLITTQPRELDSTLPDAVALNQNYPNPFNPTTQITYELPQQTDVRLTVYDMIGRQVATLVNETVQAGVHNVNFDASSLSSGVYIYRLQTGSTTLSRKLTVIK